MKRNYFLLLFVLLGFEVLSQKLPASPYGKQFKRSGLLIQAGKNKEAIAVLDSLEKHFDKMTPEDKAHFFLNMSKVHTNTKNYFEALEYAWKGKAIKSKDTVITNNFNTALAELFYHLDAYDLSIDYYKRYLEQVHKPNLRYFAVNRIGTMYLQTARYDEALSLFEEQHEISKKIGAKNFSLSALNNMGFVFFKKEDYRTASKMFLEVIQGLKAHNIKDKSLSCVAEANAGRSYFYLREYQKAIPLLESAHRFTFENGDFIRNCYIQKSLGKSYVLSGQLDKAKEFENLLRAYEDKMTVTSKIELKSFQIALYGALKETEKIRNLNEELDNLLVIQQREKKIEHNVAANVVSEYLIKEAKVKIATEKKARENTQRALSLEQRENSLIWFSTGSFIILLSVSSYLIFQRVTTKRKKAELEKEMLLLEEEKLKYQIGVQTRNLTEFAIDISYKKELNKDVVSKLKKISLLERDQLREELKQLIMELKSKETSEVNFPGTDEETQLIMLQFKNKLKELHPTLTKMDVELCMYIKLDLTNKQIANFKNISDGSVKTLKYRLKKTLGLSLDEQLSDYIAGINN